VAVEFDEGPIGAGLHGFSCPIGHGRKQSKAFWNVALLQIECMDMASTSCLYPFRSPRLR
jgi:hypothetical protein